MAEHEKPRSDQPAIAEPEEESRQHLLPPSWPRTELDMGVTLVLDERLNNCVYRGFWVDYAAAHLGHAARMVAGHPDEPLVYYACLPAEHSTFDAQLGWEVTWPLLRRGAADAVRRRGRWNHLEFEHTRMRPVIVLHNLYLGGSQFRRMLTVCGRSREDAIAGWMHVARRLRKLVRPATAAASGGGAAAPDDAGGFEHRCYSTLDPGPAAFPRVRSKRPDRELWVLTTLYSSVFTHQDWYERYALRHFATSDAWVLFRRRASDPHSRGSGPIEYLAWCYAPSSTDPGAVAQALLQTWNVASAEYGGDGIDSIEDWSDLAIDLDALGEPPAHWRPTDP